MTDAGYPSKVGGGGNGWRRESATMSRALRIEYPGAWYHVINRGAGRQRVFHSDRNRQIFLNLLADVFQLCFATKKSLLILNNFVYTEN